MSKMPQWAVSFRSANTEVLFQEKYLSFKNLGSLVIQLHFCRQMILWRNLDPVSEWQESIVSVLAKKPFNVFSNYYSIHLQLL